MLCTIVIPNGPRFSNKNKISERIELQKRKLNFYTSAIFNVKYKIL